MEDLISKKKEVLEQYGISYGALYRWKRMGLIPEAWFIRKSTTTGQETFFRRDQICPRLELILSRRDGRPWRSWQGSWRGAAAAPLCQTARGRGPVRPAGIYRGGNSKRPPDRRGTESDILEFFEGGAIMSDKMDMRISGSSTMPGERTGRYPSAGPERSKLT